MNNLYIAKFYITKGQAHNDAKYYAINIEAKNLKEARSILDDLWNNDYYGKKSDKDTPHMFSIKIRRLRLGEEYLYHYFQIIPGSEYYEFIYH